MDRPESKAARRGTRFPHNYWKGEAGQEHARLAVADIVRELGLEAVAPYLLYRSIPPGEFNKRGLGGMLHQVYRGSRSAAIEDYVQTVRPKNEPHKYPNTVPTSCQTQTQRLSLGLLGSAEIALDEVRLRALEHPGRLLSVLCLLALHPSGLRSERILALLSDDIFNADSRPGKVASHGGRVCESHDGTNVVVPLSAQGQWQEQSQVASVETTGATDATDAADLVNHKVRQMVYRIRQEAAWHGVIESRGESGGRETVYRLPGGTWCDIWEFNTKLAEARSLSDPPVLPADADGNAEGAELAFRLRAEAIELYRGDMACEIGEVTPISAIANRWC